MQAIIVGASKNESKSMGPPRRAVADDGLHIEHVPQRADLREASDFVAADLTEVVIDVDDFGDPEIEEGYIESR